MTRRGGSGEAESEAETDYSEEEYYHEDEATDWERPDKGREYHDSEEDADYEDYEGYEGE